MLQIKNLTKVYHTKGGASVRALDGVSLTFEDKGMVFLLGKSGSGKSTLLNLCGGLDKPDSGEIIVKGRGSDTFSTGDFDSYRNTYIGFIFQEYNILNEFTVEENIALALELQGKAKDKAKIDRILKDVEMEQFAKRKPNTLSGGQKQRIAIARALVKDPEIIMADEPSGALDSNTGKQVFDTLKNLSKEKLVIVVSHDREFAEIYGNRIIELKDGKVISDVTKNKIAATNASDNVSFIGSDTISIKSGAALTDNDIKNIKEFIAASSKNVLISSNDKDIAAFKKQAHIDENGAREEFSDTETEKLTVKAYSSDESKFIRSKLPLRHAVRIGASSMKVKPFRLFFTILLTFISFVMFGLFSTLMLFNEQNVLGESLKKSDDDYLNVVKMYNYTYISYYNGKKDYSYTNSRATLLKDSDVNGVYDAYGNDAVVVFNYADPNWGSSSMYIQNVNKANEFYTNTLNGFGITKEDSSFRTDEKILWGKYPSASDEIMISDFTFDSIVAAGGITQSADQGFKTVKKYADLENLVLYLGDNSTIAYKITGVYKAADVPTKYDNLKEGNIDYELLYSWNDELQYGFYTYALVSDSFYEDNLQYFSIDNNVSNNLDDYFRDTFGYYNLETGDNEYEYSLYFFSSYPAEEGFESLPIYGKDGEQLTSLGDNEIVLSQCVFADILYKHIESIVQQSANEDMRSAWYWETDDNLSYQIKCEILRDGYYIQDDITYSYGSDELIEIYRDIKQNFMKLYGIDFPTVKLSWDEFKDTPTELTAVGYIFGYSFDVCAYVGNNVYNGLHFLDKSEMDDWYSEEVTKYDETGGKYNAVFVLKTDSAIDTSMQRLFNVNSDDSFFDIQNPIKQNLDGMIQMIKVLSKVFLYVGIAFAVFSMLLLFNFISVSISNKKKEIGILRAVGARSTDVFKIFFSETTIITGICLILSVIASFVLCAVFNTMISKEMAMPLSLFVLGPVSILMMIGIAVVTALLSTFLPVYSIAKKRPVESIRAL